MRQYILFTLLIILFSTFAHSQTVFMDNSTGLYGVKDKYGEVFISAGYDEIISLNRLNNYRAVKGDYAYFFNSRGELLNKVYFQELGTFEYNAARLKQNGRYGLVNEFGDVTIPVIYDELIWPMWSYAAVSKNGRWGVSDLSHNIIVPVVYDTIIAFPSSVKYAVVKNGGKYGIVDMISGEATYRTELDDYFFTRFNFVKAVKDGKTGLLHYDGTVIARIEYDDVRIEEDARFNSKYVYVKSDGKWGINNSRGLVVFPAVYDDIGAIDKKGIITARRDGKDIRLDIRNEKEL
jgi:hypothetical protein